MCSLGKQTELQAMLSLGRKSGTVGNVWSKGAATSTLPGLWVAFWPRKEKGKGIWHTLWYLLTKSFVEFSLKAKKKQKMQTMYKLFGKNLEIILVSFFKNPSFW